MSDRQTIHLLVLEQEDELLLDAVAHAEPVVLDGARDEVRPHVAVKLGELHREVEFEAAKIIRRTAELLFGTVLATRRVGRGAEGKACKLESPGSGLGRLRNRRMNHSVVFTA